MSRTELPKTYDFSATEEKLYQWWWEKGYFKPWNDPNKADFDPDHKPYVISFRRQTLRGNCISVTGCSSQWKI